jgi:hypothetical protein
MSERIEKREIQKNNTIKRKEIKEMINIYDIFHTSSKCNFSNF